MIVLAGCLWGLLGAAAVEALDLYKAIRRIGDVPWHHPGEASFGPYLLSVIIRLGLGVLAAAVCAASGQVEGPAGALAAGYAAPKVLEQLARLGINDTEPSRGSGTKARKAAIEHETLNDRELGAKDAAPAPPDGGAR